MYETHEQLPDAEMWRYVDFAKLVSLLEHRAFCSSRAQTGWAIRLKAVLRRAASPPGQQSE